MTRLGELVATSATVAATSSRTAKVGALAGLLRSLDTDEITIAAAYLTGAPRQGRIGVAWATAATISGLANEPVTELHELDDALDRLEACTGPGSQRRRADLLADLGARLTDTEAAFVRHLLTGQLRQGALAGLMADAVARAADVPAKLVRRAAMLSGDLPATARTALTEGAPALERVHLAVGVALQPMLASTAPDVGEALAATGPASVEFKLDGVRIQAHRVGDVVHLYTRNLNDVTDRMPSVVDTLRALPVASIVLDGEVMGVTEEGIPHAFQDSAGTFGRRSTPGPIVLEASWFDALHVDGRDLVDEPLDARLAAMDAIVGLRRIPGERTDDPEVAQRVLDDALATGHEGVMVKALSSTYDAGRRGKAWRKIKPVHTLDLVVLAVEWGSGRRRGWLSNLHLGALDGQGAPVMVGKTFKGLTDEMLEWQTARFLELEERREGHVVYLRPEQVVEIALDGAQASTRYPGGVALPFAPRPALPRRQDWRATPTASTRCGRCSPGPPLTHRGTRSGSERRVTPARCGYPVSWPAIRTRAPTSRARPRRCEVFSRSSRDSATSGSSRRGRAASSSASRATRSSRPPTPRSTRCGGSRARPTRTTCSPCSRCGAPLYATKGTLVLAYGPEAPIEDSEVLAALLHVAGQDD